MAIELLVLDLLHCTNEPNVSIPSMANLLIERTQNPNWTVVYKSLITIHNIMCYGNEVRFLISWMVLKSEEVFFNIQVKHCNKKLGETACKCSASFTEATVISLD